MNWKQEAVDKLRRYNAMNLALENLPEQIRDLEDSVTQLRGIKPRRITGTTPKRGDDFLLNNIVKRQELLLAYKNAKAWVGSVNRALSVLDEEGKRVLRDIYITPGCGNIGQLCETLGVEQSSVYRKRDEALYRFTVALYGTVEQ